MDEQAETEKRSTDARRTSRRTFLKRSLYGLTAVALAEGLSEPYRIAVERVNIPITGLPAAFDGYRIALISDFHYPRQISVDYVRHTVALANRFQPDLLALTGDFVDHKGSATVPDMSRLFADAQAKDGIVGVLGNHDHWLDAEGVRRELAKNTPVRLIENECLLLERGGHALAVGGVGDLWEGVLKPEEAFAKVAPETPRILLSHNPDYAETMVPKVRIDLQLSGHTHGGEAFFPLLGAPFVPSAYGNKFRCGLVQGRKHRVYVTRGVCSIRRVRFFCPPEVTCITLRTQHAG
jgi:predicted MPP superfamily phosphohydrolase